MSKYNYFKDFRSNVINQYEQCNAYKLLCDNESYNPSRDLNTEEDINHVPFIATTLFKKSSGLYSNLLRINTKNLEKWTVSSSTSGDPSVVGRNLPDLLKIQELMRCDKKTLRPRFDYECVFYPEPEVMRMHNSENLCDKPTESYIGNLLDLFDFGKDTLFLLKPFEGNFQVDIDEFEKFITNHNNKEDYLLVGGSTPIFYNTIEYLMDKMEPVNLGKNVLIHTGGGGWDGRKGSVNIGNKIERWRFVETVSRFLGVPEENFIDSYSFTENSFVITGHYSKKHKDYLFHVPSWGRLIIRDVKTLNPLNKVGNNGFIQVLNAYGTDTFAGASVLVDDIGEIVSTKECPDCGKDEMTIKIVGRVKGAEAKGCGATLNVSGGKK